MKTLRYNSFTGVAILSAALAVVPPLRGQNYPTLLQALAPLHYWRLNETNSSPAPDVISNLGSVGPSASGYAAGGALTGQPNGIVGNCVRLLNPGGNFEYLRYENRYSQPGGAQPGAPFHD